MPINIPFRDMLSGVPKPADPALVNADVMNSQIARHLEGRPPKQALPASTTPAPAPTSPSPPRIASAPIAPFPARTQKDQDRILPEGSAPPSSLTSEENNPPLPGSGTLVEEDSQPPAPAGPKRVAGLPKRIVPSRYPTAGRVRTSKERKSDGMVARHEGKSASSGGRRPPVLPPLAVPSQSQYQYGAPARRSDPLLEYWSMMGPQIRQKMLRGEPIGV
jgi:hypothetical protein